MAASAEIVEGTMPVNLNFYQDRSFGSTSQASAKCRGNKVEYSHKMTEKRRRDRMNISMSEIAQLLPSSSESKQLEKAEILEKTIIYIKKLQEITGKHELDSETGQDNHRLQENQEVTTSDGQPLHEQAGVTSNYCSGFKDCIKEVFHCLTNVEAMDLQQPCFLRLMGHLQRELHSMSGNAERSSPENNQQGPVSVQSQYLNATCDGSTDKLSSLKGHYNLACKRPHESVEAGEASSSENFSSKRMHVDESGDNNGSNTSCTQGVGSSSVIPQGNDSSFHCCSAQGSTRKEKPKASVRVGNVWVANGSQYSHVESSVAEKGKDTPSHGVNMSERANVDGNRCGSESAVGCHKYSSSEMPVLATPISPRTPYIANPFTTATYALHPSGTHYMPVVLHMPVVPQFAEIKGGFNSSANGYMAAVNCMRMGSFQYPCFPYGMPIAPHIAGSMMGVNSIHNPLCKQEPESQKQCELKPKEIDSCTNDYENTSVQVCSSTDKPN